MKALYYREWEKLEIADVPPPRISEGEVLLRVSNCGVCGSELETFRAHSPRRTPPLIMGHEFCGYIEEVRDPKSNWTKGQRVIAHAIVHCGLCAPCLRGDTNLCINRQIFGMHRPGAFAEYVAVPQQAVIPWPEGLPGATAVLTEPLANGINAMRQSAAVRKSRVLVIGAGPIGLMCIFAAKQLYGSSVIVSDLIPERLNAARIIGADKTVNIGLQDLAPEMKEHWSGNAPELVIDAVGSARTKLLSLELVEPGGGVVWLGLHEDEMQLNSYALTLGQKSVSGSYSGSFNDLQQAALLLASGAMNTSWTTQYPLDRGEAGFRDMLLGTSDKIKAIFNIYEHHPRP
jgi:L-iditol 2-dehydrogenase